jgi:hypothetical protein
VRSQKFDHAVALLKAAMRNGLAEPWMYEALALALEASSADKQEIERALLSAADVVSDSPDAQYRVARMLARHDLKASAIRLYREVSEQAPLAPEPYAESLDVALVIGDFQTVRWAATRLLSQGWVEHQDELYKKARNSATEMERRLRRDGRDKEADELATALRHADRRDLVIRMTWQGDADIDLRVLEPLGTVCSAQNRMTPAGGVLVKDGSGKDPGSDKNPAELYVCGQGLPGPYEITVHRVWGSPLGGRVKIEVTYHERTDSEKHQTHYIPVTGTKPLIVQLDAGRRTQLLAVPQVVPARSSAGQSATPLQQLQQLAQSQSGDRFGGPQQLFQVGGANVAGGAVAFDPTITTFFVGPGLAVQAVVSADRRYVRLSLFPFFNQLAGERRFTVSGAVGGGGFR